MVRIFQSHHIDGLDWIFFCIFRVNIQLGQFAIDNIWYFWLPNNIEHLFNNTQNLDKILMDNIGKFI